MKKKATTQLLKSMKNIIDHKVLQAKGFKILANRTKNKQIKRILQKYSDQEYNSVNIWHKKIKEFNNNEKIRNNFAANIKTSFIFKILGPKGFLSWAIEGELEAIQKFEIEIEKLTDLILSNEWKIMTSDERFHIERIKKEFLGDSWEAHNGGGVRDMIFGLNDGLVSTLAFIAGTYAAFFDSRIVLISGFAELLAGTISMAVSSYQSSKSEIEVVEKERRKICFSNGKKSINKKNDLLNYYQKKGFSLTDAKAIAKKIEEDETIQILRLHKEALNQLGLSSENIGNPIRSGFLCGLSFAFAALIPLIPFFLPIESADSITISILASILTLFGAGCLKTIFSRKKWIKSGLEMMIIGIIAAGITYIIGNLFSLII